jgi:N-acetylmuramoyl-L-alanine amidase
MKSLIHFFNIIKNKLFGSSKPSSGTTPTAPVKAKAKAKKIFLAVGHGAGDSGMIIYKNAMFKTEFTFNQQIAILAKSMINKELIDVKIGYRPDGSYSSAMRKMAQEASEWGADVAIELHLNASGIPEARGFEILTNSMSEKFARVIADSFIEGYDLRARGDRGVKILQAGDRGTGFLNAMKSEGLPALLIEPCFADYRTSESVQIIEDHQGYADFIAKTLEQFA